MSSSNLIKFDFNASLLSLPAMHRANFIASAIAIFAPSPANGTMTCAASPMRVTPCLCGHREPFGIMKSDLVTMLSSSATEKNFRNLESHPLYSSASMFFTPTAPKTSILLSLVQLWSLTPQSEHLIDPSPICWRLTEWPSEKEKIDPLLTSL